MLFNDNAMIDRFGAAKGKVCGKCNSFALVNLTHETNDTNNEITVCLVATKDKKEIRISDTTEYAAKACGLWADRIYIPF